MSGGWGFDDRFRGFRDPRVEHAIAVLGRHGLDRRTLVDYSLEELHSIFHAMGIRVEMEGIVGFPGHEIGHPLAPDNQHNDAHYDDVFPHVDDTYHGDSIGHDDFHGDSREHDDGPGGGGAPRPHQDEVTHLDTHADRLAHNDGHRDIGSVRHYDFGSPPHNDRHRDVHIFHQDGHTDRNRHQDVSPPPRHADQGPHFDHHWDDPNNHNDLINHHDIREPLHADSHCDERHQDSFNDGPPPPHQDRPHADRPGFIDV